MIIESSLFAFVLMPFSEGFDDVYNLGIKEMSTQEGFKTERVDEQKFEEGILDRIYGQINACDLVIADMTGKNPNVFYEVGYAHAKNKMCILLTQNVDDIPFDFKHKRHVAYDNVTSLREKLKDELVWARTEIRRKQSLPFDVTINNRYGWIEKGTYSAVAVLSRDMKIAKGGSDGGHEIDSIWLYSGDRTTVFQDDKIVASMKSDIDRYQKRHCLTPPTKRILSGSWISFTFSIKKTIAYKVEGKELDDKYRVQGITLIRIISGDKPFDIPVNIDEEIEVSPF